MPAPVKALAVGASPFVFKTAFSQGTCFVIVQGGNVTKIEFSRDGKIFFDTGVTQGPIPMSGSDSVRVTYAAPPTMTFVP